MPKDCASCQYLFVDAEVGFGGCALLLELPGTPVLTQEEYLALDLYDPTRGEDCPQWKEDDFGKEAVVGGL